MTNAKFLVETLVKNSSPYSLENKSFNMEKKNSKFSKF